MNPRVLNVPLALRRQLLAQVRAVLVFDVFDDRIPAAVIVHEIAVAGRVDDVEAKAHAILLDDVGDGVDLGGAADGLVGRQAAFAIDKVRGEDGVDQGGLAKTGLAYEEDISEMPLERQLVCAVVKSCPRLDVPTQMTLN